MPPCDIVHEEMMIFIFMKSLLESNHGSSTLWQTVVKPCLLRWEINWGWNDKKTTIIVFLLLSDYWYFLEDFNSVKLFFSSGTWKKGKAFVKRERKVLPRFACSLICWRWWQYICMIAHAWMEWDSKEEIKAGKEGVRDRSEFHQEVSILN